MVPVRAVVAVTAEHARQGRGHDLSCSRRSILCKATARSGARAAWTVAVCLLGAVGSTWNCQCLVRGPRTATCMEHSDQGLLHAAAKTGSQVGTLCCGGGGSHRRGGVLPMSYRDMVGPDPGLQVAAARSSCPKHAGVNCCRPLVGICLLRCCLHTAVQRKGPAGQPQGCPAGLQFTVCWLGKACQGSCLADDRRHYLSEARWHA